jgi:DNA polymerase-4
MVFSVKRVHMTGIVPYRPVVLHADMDAFYAAIEQRDRPELRGRPVVVGGTASRGVVTAASYEARRFGVHSAMPAAEAHRRCPDAVFLRGDMAKYRRVSREVQRVFASVSPEVEPLSLDEAFIDVTASVGLLGPPLAIGCLLRERVRAATGLAVSVGIASGKMVAKIASDVAKPDGLLEVPPDGVRAFLDPLPVGRLWGVGPVTQATLEAAGFRTVGDVRRATPHALGAVVGRAADHLARLARGEDARVVDPDRDARTYGEEGTFDRDTRDDRRIRGAIIAHAEAVARRLRHDHLRTRTIVLKMKLAARAGRPGKFRLLTRRATLAEATDDGHALAAVALRLWEEHRPSIALRLVGVAAAGLAGDAGQIALFPDAARSRRAALNDALDRIVARFGASSIGPAGARAEQSGLTHGLKRGS